MAEFTITVYDAGRVAASGANYTDNKTAATSGNNYNIPNNGRVGLILECTAGGTATLATPGTVDGLAITDLTLTTAAAKILLWGAFPPSIYNNSSNNLVLTVSAATNAFAFRLN
jgi:hypothetical protein